MYNSNATKVTGWVGGPVVPAVRAAFDIWLGAIYGKRQCFPATQKELRSFGICLVCLEAIFSASVVKG